MSEKNHGANELYKHTAMRVAEERDLNTHYGTKNCKHEDFTENQDGDRTCRDCGLRTDCHVKDSQCTVDTETLCCTVCGVSHGEPCMECNGAGYHVDGCSEIEEGE